MKLREISSGLMAVEVGGNEIGNIFRATTGRWHVGSFKESYLNDPALEHWRTSCYSAEDAARLSVDIWKEHMENPPTGVTHIIPFNPLKKFAEGRKDREEARRKRREAAFDDNQELEMFPDG